MALNPNDNGNSEPIWYGLLLIIAMLVYTFFMGYAFGKVL